MKNERESNAFCGIYINFYAAVSYHDILIGNAHDRIAVCAQQCEVLEKSFSVAVDVSVHMDIVTLFIVIINFHMEVLYYDFW